MSFTEWRVELKGWLTTAIGPGKTRASATWLRSDVSWCKTHRAVRDRSFVSNNLELGELLPEKQCEMLRTQPHST